MVKLRSSTSTKTGSAPVMEMASAVAMKLLGTVITSSPALMPRAARASQSASVPLLTPTALFAPQ